MSEAGTEEARDEQPPRVPAHECLIPGEEPQQPEDDPCEQRQQEKEEAEDVEEGVELCGDEAQRGAEAEGHPGRAGEAELEDSGVPGPDLLHAYDLEPLGEAGRLRREALGRAEQRGEPVCLLQRAWAELVGGVGDEPEVPAGEPR